MRTIEPDVRGLRRSGSVSDALAKRSVRSTGPVWRKSLSDAIRVAEIELAGKLREAPKELARDFLAETILCKCNAERFGLRAGSPVKQLELKEKLCAVGVPWEDVLMVESKIAKALDRHR